MDRFQNKCYLIKQSFHKWRDRIGDSAVGVLRFIDEIILKMLARYVSLVHRLGMHMKTWI